ncbi:MAG: hypothetical protein GY937_23045 [bacterium]|nr:hypothetical protein [bacterium]
MSQILTVPPVQIDHMGKWKAALARVEGRTQTAAAEAADVTRETVSRWETRDPLYRTYFEEHQTALRRASWGLVWGVLMEHVASRDPAVSLRACHIMLQSIDRERPQEVTVTNEERVVIVVEDEDELSLEAPV